MKKPTEGDLIKAVLEYLNVVCGLFAWRNNTGMSIAQYRRKDGVEKKRAIRYGYPGSSDIVGVFKDGRILCVECKKPGGCTDAKRAALQADFGAHINRMGGIYVRIETLDELIVHLNDVIQKQLLAKEKK